MAPTHRHNLVISLFFLLLSLVLAALAYRTIGSNWDHQKVMIITGLSALIGAAFGVIVTQHLNQRPSSPGQNENTLHPALLSNQEDQFEIDLFKGNQELYSRAQEQANELSRLNTELQLQMAMNKQAEEATRLSEERFRQMAENIQEGLTIYESDRLIYLNERACEIFGDCPQGDITDRILNFAALHERERLSGLFQNITFDPISSLEIEFWIARKDGQSRCIHEHYTHSTSAGVARTFIVSSDITESVQAYQVLEQTVSDRTRELFTVLDISQRIASTLEMEPLFTLILDQIKTIIPYIGAAIFTLEDSKLLAVAYNVPGLQPQNQPAALSLASAESYSKIIDHKQVLIIDDIQGDTPLARAFAESNLNPKGFSFSHARSWIGIPLIVRDRVTGLLSLAHDQPKFYTQQHARLALSITNQVAAAIENARLYEEAQNLAVIEERNRIARELHDSVTQLLYGICLHSSAATRKLHTTAFEKVEESLSEIKENALQALQEMRLLILELNPPKLQKEGLAAALQASLETIETRTGLETTLEISHFNRLPRVIETELYRIAMEALNNLIRYAHARNVSVMLAADEKVVQLEIADNGVGFDLVQARKSGGMGLHNMEQRARQIGGQLEITSHPGSGTRIQVHAPLSGVGRDLYLN